MSVNSRRTSTKMQSRTKLALALLIGPSVLLIICGLLFAFAGSFFPVMPEPIAPGTVPDPPLPIQILIYATLFLTITVMSAWLPALIFGIILLTTKKMK